MSRSRRRSPPVRLLTARLPMGGEVVVAGGPRAHRLSDRLPPDHLLQVLGVPLTTDLDLGRRAIDVLQVLGGELNLLRPKVLLESIALGRSGNWHNPRLLREQPGERNLGGCRVLALG